MGGREARRRTVAAKAGIHRTVPGNVARSDGCLKAKKILPGAGDDGHSVLRPNDDRPAPGAGGLPQGRTAPQVMTRVEEQGFPRDEDGVFDEVTHRVTIITVIAVLRRGRVLSRCPM